MPEHVRPAKRTTPQSPLEPDLDVLVGLSVAVAQEAVRQAGGVVRMVAPAAPVTADFMSLRVTLAVRDDRGVAAYGLS